VCPAQDCSFTIGQANEDIHVAELRAAVLALRDHHGVPVDTGSRNALIVRLADFLLALRVKLDVSDDETERRYFWGNDTPSCMLRQVFANAPQ